MEEEDGDEDGVVIVVVVGMKEEMEERKMVELVVEMEGRVEKMAGQWEDKGLGGLLFRWLLAGRRKKKKMKEKERKGGGYIRENDYYNIAIGI